MPCIIRKPRSTITCDLRLFLYRASVNMEKQTIKIQDVTLSQLRKAVNVVMIKFDGKDGYRDSDLIRKILRKVKCDYSQRAYGRVRNLLRSWKISKDEISRFGKDSKKGILTGDSKRGIIKDKKNAIRNLHSNKKNLVVNLNLDDGEEKTQNEIEKSVDVTEGNINQDEKPDDETESNINQNDKQNETEANAATEQNKKVNKEIESDNKVPPVTNCNCSCSCKNRSILPDIIIKQEIIDLTDDEPVIKTETNQPSEIKHETIDLTIDDIPIKSEDSAEMYDINQVINQLEGPYYSQPPIIYLVHVTNEAV